MKKIASLLLVLFSLLALTLAASADTFDGTMVRSSTADPDLFFYNGNYYLTQTGTSRIAIFETDSIEDLGSLALSKNISYTAYYNNVVYDPTVTELFGEGATVSGTWSPEIHYFSEEQFPGNSGWYLFVALRKTANDSSCVRMVVLKSTTDSPKGPYGHPTKGTENYSQPLLDKDGNVWDEWACGQTVLTIPEGEYKGTYAMWVAEEGRGSSGADGTFHQKIMIAKMSSPWQLASDAGIITTPTQSWEYKGASTSHPAVVEGATPVYGKNGEIFLTYSGSGYWSDYGLGQLTWNGGDPLETSSWVKLDESKNPIFTATTATNLRGAGHASFLTDTDGNGFFCYHAYAYEYNDETGKIEKATSRDAYIEPYYIDYTEYNGVSYGVIKLGLNGDGVAADTSSTVTFATDGEYLTAPTVAAADGTAITLTMSEENAAGYMIYRSTDGEVFDYLATVVASAYTDADVTAGNTYYYRAYAYREEEISEVSETVSALAKTAIDAPQITVQTSVGTALFGVTAASDYDGFEIYYSDDGEDFSLLYDYATSVSAGETQGYADGDSFADGETYYVKARGYVGGTYSDFSEVVEFTMPIYIKPPTMYSVKQTTSGTLRVQVKSNGDYDGVRIYHSTDGETYTIKKTLDHSLSTDVIAGTSISKLSAGMNYFYLTAVVGDAESERSAITSYNVIVVETPTITDISATCKSITLTYEGEGEYDSYTIYRYVIKTDEDIGDYYTADEIATTTETTYTVTDVTCGEEYLFGVKGTASGVSSAVSEAQSIIPAHAETDADGLDATCTEDGYTAYTYCESCGEVLSGKETISSEGHSYEVTEAEIPATETSVGKTAVYTCAACGDSYGGEEIPMLTPSEEVLAGDATGDGKITFIDVLRTLKYAVGMDVEINFANADMNGDNEITIADVLAVIKLFLNS